MFKKYQLRNGLTVLLQESRKSPVVSVQMWVRTGSADEQPAVAGISHFIEHLVFKGTPDFSVGEIAAAVEGAGGELNAYTSFDQTVFYVTISEQFVDTAMKVISQMMGSPQFDPQEIDNEREVVIEEIKRSADSPARQASRLLFETAYKGHPYSRPVIGYEKVIQKLSPETIRHYFDARYNPSNMYLIVSGDFTLGEMKKKVDEYFGSFEAKTVKKVQRSKEKAQSRVRVKVAEADFRDSFLHFGWKIPGARSKDIAALDVLALILGQGDSSRLTQRLRVEQGVAKSVRAGTFSPSDKGLFVVSAVFDPEQMETGLDLIQQEILRMVEEGPTYDELQKAITNFESDELYGMETVDGLAQKFGFYEFLFKDPNYYEVFIKQVYNLVPSDIRRVARKYLNHENLSAVLLTDQNTDQWTKHLRQWVRKYSQNFLQAKSLRRPAAKVLKAKKLKWPKSKGQGKVPQVEKLEFDQGVNVYLRSHHDVPTISMKVGFLGGVRAEPTEQGGLGELMQRVWPTGTVNYSETEISEMNDRNVSLLNAFAGRNSLGITLDTLQPFLSPAAELMTEVLLEPTFPDAAIEREKAYMLQSLKSLRDSPTQICILQFLEAFFGKHPYGRSPLGTEQSITQLSREDLLAYRRKLIVPENMTVVATGAVTEKQLRPFVEKLLRSLPSGEKFSKRFDHAPPSAPVHLFEAMKKEQSHLVMGFPGLTFQDEDRYGLQVMESLLAGQGGRLFMELRDKASLAYSVAPLRMEGIDAGYFGAYIGCSPEKVEKAVSMMRAEFDRLIQQKVSDNELERAKRYLVGRHDIHLQRSTHLASALLFDCLYEVSPYETFQFAKKIHNVTAADIQRIAAQVFESPAVISVVGPEGTSKEPSFQSKAEFQAI